MKNNQLTEEYKSLVRMLNDKKDFFYMYFFKNGDMADSVENCIGYIKYDVFNHRLSKFLKREDSVLEGDMDYVSFQNERDLRFTKHLYSLEIVKNFLVENRVLFEKKNITNMYYLLGDYFNLQNPLLMEINELDFFSFLNKKVSFSEIEKLSLKKLLIEINNITKVITDKFRSDSALVDTFKVKKLSELE